MPKFEAGDKVVVLPRKEGQLFQEPCYVDSMTKYAGRWATIDRVNGREQYILNEVPFLWRADWLEPLAAKAIESAADMDALYA